MYGCGEDNANARHAVNQARIGGLGQNIEDRLERRDKAPCSQNCRGDLVCPDRRMLEFLITNVVWCHWPDTCRRGSVLLIVTSATLHQNESAMTEPAIPTGRSQHSACGMAGHAETG